MSLEKKVAVEFILFFVLLATIIGVGYFSFEVLINVFTHNLCTSFFLVVCIILSMIYGAIEHKLDSKIV